jgi:hypothetical protein
MKRIFRIFLKNYPEYPGNPVHPVDGFEKSVTGYPG